MDLFNDAGGDGIKIERSLLESLREELRALKACAESALTRAAAVEDTLNAMLAANATPVANPTNGKAVAVHVPKLLLSRFDQEFQKKFGEPAPINGGKDAAIMKRLVTPQRPVERVAELIEAFFASNDPFIRQSGYTVGAFASQIGKLIVEQRGPAQVHGFTTRTAHNSRNAQAGAAMIRQAFTRK